MSLLVFNSSNRIAQGVLRHLWKSGQFEKIVCADLYPNYNSIQRFCQLRDQLDQVQSKVKLTDIKISEKTDLYYAIKGASHLLYITHDYYQLTASKVNLLGQCTKLAKEQGHLQKVVALTPVEFDHYGEQDPNGVASNSQVKARNEYPDLVHVKSDLTFGQDSGVVNQLLYKIANNVSVCFQPSAEKPSPIHTEDLANVVAQLLTNQTKGASYLAKGPKQIGWDALVDTLSGALGQKATLNSNFVENLISPLSNNILSENFHCESYRNLTQFLKNYKAPSGDFQDLKSFNLQLKELEKVYAQNSLKKENFPKCKAGVAECLLL